MLISQIFSQIVNDIVIYYGATPTFLLHLFYSTPVFTPGMVVVRQSGSE
jgi:hypothetical protein